MLIHQMVLEGYASTDALDLDRCKCSGQMPSAIKLLFRRGYTSRAVPLLSVGAVFGRAAEFSASELDVDRVFFAISCCSVLNLSEIDPSRGAPDTTLRTQHCARGREQSAPAPRLPTSGRSILHSRSWARPRPECELTSWRALALAHQLTFPL